MKPETADWVEKAEGGFRTAQHVWEIVRKA
jgi:hypothetical protein